MGSAARHPPAQQDALDQRFRAVSEELEGLVWQLLGPGVDSAPILQMDAVVEILPRVYAQVIRLAYQHAPDRYVRVWCVVAAHDGAEEERTLLCFYTPGFPDPQLTQVRPGMDLNPAWWDAVRERLLMLQPQIEPPAEPTLSPTPPEDPNEHSPTGAMAAARMAQDTARRAQLLFDECLAQREEAFRHRDELERQLRDTYFALYPFMRQATKYASELDTDTMIMKWMRQGCPPPQKESAPSTTSGAAPDQPSTGVPSSSPAASAEPDTSAMLREKQPWKTALEFERTIALIQERTTLLERLCELAGGHYPLTTREGASGRPHTVCKRCAAELFSWTPDTREEWVN